MATQTAVEILNFDDNTGANVSVSDRKIVPEPVDSQVLVRLRLRPINPSDIFSLQGVYAGFQPKHFPATPGLEGMGVVEKLGPKAFRLKVGQRVIVSPDAKESGDGTWQQYIAIPEALTVPVPDKVSDEAAAQFMVNPVTAYCFLELVPKGKWLVHNAANSALGKALISMARHQGIKTINLVRREEAVQDLKELGPDAVINVSEDGLDLTKKIWEITGGEGAWAAFNAVAGAVNADIMKGLRDGGTCYIYGVIAGMNAEVPMPDVLFRRLQCKGFWLMQYIAGIPSEQKEKILSAVMDMLSQGVFKPEPPSVKLPLQKISEALEAYERNAGKGGKVLLEG